MNIEVYMGKIAIGEERDILGALGIGSCIVVTLYDSNEKKGALAHAMLPSRNNGSDNRYVDVAIENMLDNLESMGARRQNMEAKMIGGANMFGFIESNLANEIVSCARETLIKEGVNLIGEVIGGSQGRSVEFDVSSGIVTVKVKF